MIVSKLEREHREPETRLCKFMTIAWLQSATTCILPIRFLTTILLPNLYMLSCGAGKKGSKTTYQCLLKTWGNWQGPATTVDVKYRFIGNRGRYSLWKECENQTQQRIIIQRRGHSKGWLQQIVSSSLDAAKQSLFHVLNYAQRIGKKPRPLTDFILVDTAFLFCGAELCTSRTRVYKQYIIHQVYSFTWDINCFDLGN